LYQAVILALSFPLLILPYLRDIFTRHGRTPKLYLSILAGLSTVIPLCLLYLGPYFTLFHGGYARKGKEMLAHSLEPLAYLGHTLTQGLMQINFAQAVKTDEMSVFPSLTILFLTLGYGFYNRRILLYRPGRKRECRGLPALRQLRLAALLTFFALLCFISQNTSIPANDLLRNLGNGTLIPALLITIILAVTTRHEREAGKLCSGLSAAALLCFILSLGPSLRVLSQRALADNMIFSFVNTFFPLSGFRVMSRFSIIVMLFLIIIASCFLDQICQKKQQFQWIGITLLSTLFLEAALIPHPYRRFSLPITPHTLQTIKEQKQPVVVIPLGDRHLDSRYMLAIGGSHTMLVNGWGGFIPPLQEKIGRDFKRYPQRAVNLVNSIWPTPLLIIDRQALRQMKTSGYATGEDFIRNRGHLLAEDPFFSVYRLKEPEGPLREYRRFIRADYLRNNPLYRFEARKIDNDNRTQELFVLLNGTVIAAVPLTAKWQEYTVQIPQQGVNGVNYEMVFLRALHASTWMARKGTFYPLPSSAVATTPNYAALARKVWQAGPPHWLNYLTKLPPQAIPLRLKYGNKIRLEGVTIQTPQLLPGTTFRFTSYWSLPAKLGKNGFLARADFYGPQQEHFSFTAPLLHKLPFTFRLSQPVKKIFRQNHAIHIPSAIPTGSYRVQISLINAVTKRTFSPPRIKKERFLFQVREPGFSP